MKRKPKFWANDFRMTPNVEDAARQVSWARGLKGENIPHDISWRWSPLIYLAIQKKTQMCIFKCNKVLWAQVGLGQRLRQTLQSSAGPMFQHRWGWGWTSIPRRLFLKTSAILLFFLLQYHGNIMAISWQYYAYGNFISLRLLKQSLLQDNSVQSLVWPIDLILNKIPAIPNIS